jgi:hypothetical protein
MTWISPRSAEKLSHVAFGLTAVLVVMGLATLVRVATGDSHEPLLPISRVDAFFGSAKLGVPIPIRFALHNRGSRPIRVLGSPYICTKQGCIRGTGFPLEIPGSDSQDVELVLLPQVAGNFEMETLVYTNAPEVPEVPVIVRGTVR